MSDCSYNVMGEFVCKAPAAPGTGMGILPYDDAFDGTALCSHHNNKKRAGLMSDCSYTVHGKFVCKAPAAPGTGTGMGMGMGILPHHDAFGGTALCSHHNNKQHAQMESYANMNVPLHLAQPDEKTIVFNQ